MPNLSLKPYVTKLSHVLLFSVTASLAACGGGEDDASNSKANDNQASAGQFKQSADTGIYYSTARSGMYISASSGWLNNDCVNTYRDRYYEADNVLVFGNPALPESDYRQAASWVESNFANALEAMQLTQADYFALRGQVRLSARAVLFEQLQQLRWHPQDSLGQLHYPGALEDTNSNAFGVAFSRWAETTANTASDDQVTAALLDTDYSEYSSADDIHIENKIYVCLHEGTDPSMSGEGVWEGINIAAPSVYKPHNVDTFITHELIHTVQMALGNNVFGLALPRWFTEGQAEYLAGGDTAKRSNNGEFDPQLVVNGMQQSLDMGEAYKHYALAYSYLDSSNGRANMVALIQKTKALPLNSFPYEDLSDREDPRFRQAFDELMLDMQGAPLSIDRWRDDYHSLMNDWH
ncbi:hypothetical protein [Shewanella sp.]|uniref:hypothetical protein n=1 Tax=Shewanella sp. TaxID=50422 RepID=UPI003A97D33F